MYVDNPTYSEINSLERRTNLYKEKLGPWYFGLEPAHLSAAHYILLKFIDSWTIFENCITKRIISFIA
jgi:hypothetical protein